MTDAPILRHIRVRFWIIVRDDGEISTVDTALSVGEDEEIFGPYVVKVPTPPRVREKLAELVTVYEVDVTEESGGQ